MDFYKEKYLKYKKKYLNLKNQINGGGFDDLPTDQLFLTIQTMDCKEIENFAKASPVILNYLNNLTPEQWKDLASKFKLTDDFELPSNYQRNICKGEESCKIFFANCFHNYLKEKYKNDDLKECWYESIRRGETKDYDYFNIFLIDTTRIDNRAFYTNKLESVSVSIPKSVTIIGKEAFFKNNLISVTIPDSVTSIGSYAFYNNKLESVSISNLVTIIIHDYAFARNNLTSVTIPESVTSIGLGAFFNNNLTSVDIGSSVTVIANYAFSKNKLTSVTIPESVNSIGAGAFKNNELTEVTIPKSVNSIDAGAFKNNELTEVTIPNPETSISNAFDEGVIINLGPNIVGKASV